MKMPAVVLIFVVLSTVLVPSLQSQAQENDYLIVPGQRVGRWELGKPLDTYGFGQPLGRWEGRAQDGRPYYEGFTIVVPTGRAALQVYTCASDKLVFALIPWRRVDQPDQTESVKYKTAEGISIGTVESEIVTLLGRPGNIGEWTERHGSIDVSVKGLTYPGLRILVNKADQRVFAIGATTRGGFAACYEAVLGRPTTAQQATPQPQLRLPVPMPPNLVITRPGPDVPPAQAAYSGIWVGKWDDTLDTALAVSEIRDGRIRGVYAWGTATLPPWNISRSGWQPIQGIFNGPNLLVEIPPIGSATYRVIAEGVMEGILFGLRTNRATLRKVP